MKTSMLENHVRGPCPEWPAPHQIHQAAAVENVKTHQNGSGQRLSTSIIHQLDMALFGFPAQFRGIFFALYLELCLQRSFGFALAQ
jgi:hypothetical protein